MAAGRLAVLLAAAALAAPAVAAQAPTVAPSGPGPGRIDRSEHREARRARMQAHAQQAAADVALLLRLKPGQQAAYQAWTAALRPPEARREGRGGEREQAQDAPRTLPQKLDLMQARMADREQRVRTRLDATRRFYAALSPEQQPLFDALLRLRHGGGLRGAGMRRWGMQGGVGGWRGGEGAGGPPAPAV